MSILSILLQAIPIGLAISVAPGAAFLGIIQTSINKGFKSGIFFALGIAISDIVIISLCIWGLAGLLQHETIRLIFSLLGGIILIIYGLTTFFNKKNRVNTQRQNEVLANTDKFRLGLLKDPAQGFIFNFTNPFVWILWIGIFPNSGDTIQMQVLFFIVILSTIFCIDLLKSFFAGKIKKAITHELAFTINRIVGLVFCALGIFMIIRMLILLYH